MLTQRLLSIFQLTRMALVFTAISNSLCSVLLLAKLQSGAAGNYKDFLDFKYMLAASVISFGLYCYGMTVNDIIDRRRDSQMAAYRPLPSGRIRMSTAHLIATFLLVAAILGGVYLARTRPAANMTLLLLGWTALLITFYDIAGKYLVALGLITLGLIRFFHAWIPAAPLPLLWHPLLLLNHVTILSAVCYQLEQKRPPLTKLHWTVVLGGLALLDAISIAGVFWLHTRQLGERGFVESLWIQPALVYPASAAILFIAIAIIVKRRAKDPRSAGQSLMLYGLLWLIVYDVAFVAGYVAVVPAVKLLLLLPAGYLSVQFMRWWSRILSLSQKPAFQRAR